MSLRARHLIELVPSIRSIVRSRVVGGGCISQAERVLVETNDGSTLDLFVKSNDPSFAENFSCESEGLSRIAEADSIAVPRVIATGVAMPQTNEARAMLVLEWIDSGVPGEDFFADFGRRLARLHRETLSDAIGLQRDNFLGSTRQINSPTTTWTEFVAQHRIGFQLRLAVDQGLANARLRRDVTAVIDTMAELLAGRQDATSLVHGDLWSGNYLCDSGGQPVLVDPAIYHGCRESEFGMLRLFGGCHRDFYDAYQSDFPMPDGWQRRTSVYVLYHLLNHLNLFGSGYLDQCQSLAAEILSST